MITIALEILKTASVLTECEIEIKRGDDHKWKSALALTLILLAFVAIGHFTGNPWEVAEYLAIRIILFNGYMSYRKHKHIWRLGSNITDRIEKLINKHVAFAFRVSLLNWYIIYKIIL